MRRMGGRVFRYLYKILAIIELDARKLRHDPVELFTRALQPALWFLVFGEVMDRARAIPTGTVRYLDFFAPGILAQSVLFISIFYGIAIIWERDLGILHKFLVSPTPRSVLVLGKAFSAGLRALSQAVMIYALALARGVDLNGSPTAILALLAFVVLGAAVFSTFSLVIACWVKTRERFMGVGQVMTMPLFFASNAIYPIALMPPWLRALSHVNPLTYEVDALRALMIRNVPSAYGIGFDFLVLAGALTLLVALASKLYPRIVV